MFQHLICVTLAKAMTIWEPRTWPRHSGLVNLGLMFSTALTICSILSKYNKYCDNITGAIHVHNDHYIFQRSMSLITCTIIEWSIMPIPNSAKTESLSGNPVRYVKKLVFKKKHLQRMMNLWQLFFYKWTNHNKSLTWSWGQLVTHIYQSSSKHFDQSLRKVTKCGLTRCIWLVPFLWNRGL